MLPLLSARLLNHGFPASLIEYSKVYPFCAQVSLVLSCQVLPDQHQDQPLVVFDAWQVGHTATWKMEIQTPMARDRSAKIISMITWIRTSRLSIKKSLAVRRIACGPAQVLPAAPTQGPSRVIQKSFFQDFWGNVGDSRPKLTKASQWLQERASDNLVREGPSSGPLFG